MTAPITLMLVAPFAVSSKTTKSPSLKVVGAKVAASTQFEVLLSQFPLTLPRQRSVLGKLVEMTTSIVLSAALLTMNPDNPGGTFTEKLGAADS